MEEKLAAAEKARQEGRKEEAIRILMGAGRTRQRAEQEVEAANAQDAERYRRAAEELMGGGKGKGQEEWDSYDGMGENANINDRQIIAQGGAVRIGASDTGDEIYQMPDGRIVTLAQEAQTAFLQKQSLAFGVLQNVFGLGAQGFGPLDGVVNWMIGKKPVHEPITDEAARAAGIQDPAIRRWLIAGNRSNDIPEGQAMVAIVLTLAERDPELAHMLFGDTTTFRTHLGDLSHWHSMAGGVGEDPNDTTTKIMRQLESWYKYATGDNSPNGDRLRTMAMGQFTHEVQDSFSQAHTRRDEQGRIVEYYAYEGQDHDDHAGWDAQKSEDASRVSADLLKMWQQKAPWSEVKDYLQKNVYRLAPDARPAGIGFPQHYHPGYLDNQAYAWYRAILTTVGGEWR